MSTAMNTGLREFKAAFQRNLHHIDNNESIVETMAALKADHRTEGFDSTAIGATASEPRFFPTSATAAASSLRYGAGVNVTHAERVVRSHLTHLQTFEPFRNGSVVLDTVYEFMFDMVFVKGRRTSYVERVLASIISYLRHLVDRGVNSDTNLSEASVAFLTGPEARIPMRKRVANFLRHVGRLAEATGNTDVMRVVIDAKRKRPLVFTADVEQRLFRHCDRVLRAAVIKYCPHGVDGDHVTTETGWLKRITDAADWNTLPNELRILHDLAPENTPAAQLVSEKTAFEFAVAYVLGFLSGARIKSSILKLTNEDATLLFEGECVERYTKDSFTKFNLPLSVVREEHHLMSGIVKGVRQNTTLYCGTGGRFVSPSVRGNDDDETTLPINNSTTSIGVSIASYNVLPPPRWTREVLDTKNRQTEYQRRQALNSGGGTADTHPAGVSADSDSPHVLFFTRTARRLELYFDKLFYTMFGQRRDPGTRWHAQRRRYLSTVNDSHGALVASRSVGHSDVRTTMMYLNSSINAGDVRGKTNDAIYRQYTRARNSQS